MPNPVPTPQPVPTPPAPTPTPTPTPTTPVTTVGAGSASELQQLIAKLRALGISEKDVQAIVGMANGNMSTLRGLVEVYSRTYSQNQWMSAFDNALAAYGLQSWRPILMGIIQAESGGNPYVINASGAAYERIRKLLPALQQATGRTWRVTGNPNGTTEISVGLWQLNLGGGMGNSLTGLGMSSGQFSLKEVLGASDTDLIRAITALADPGISSQVTQQIATQYATLLQQGVPAEQAIRRTLQPWTTSSKVLAGADLSAITSGTTTTATTAYPDLSDLVPGLAAQSAGSLLPWIQEYLGLVSSDQTNRVSAAANLLNALTNASSEQRGWTQLSQLSAAAGVSPLEDARMRGNLPGGVPSWLSTMAQTPASPAIQTLTQPGLDMNSLFAQAAQATQPYAEQIPAWALALVQAQLEQERRLNEAGYSAGLGTQ